MVQLVMYLKLYLKIYQISFVQGYTNKKENILKAISKFPSFEDIPIRKKNFTIYFV